jgi:phage I-like protein
MNEIIGYCLLNRDYEMPSDGWYHIAPIGTFSHPSGIQQVIDSRSIKAMVNAFREDETKLGDHFPGLLVDFDHFSNDPTAPSEAAGWIDDLKSRPGTGNDAGLWAHIRWSDIGEAAVKGGRYRLVSPVWNPADCERADGPNAVRPMRMDRVAVTNDPNLKGMNPLTNRRGGFASLLAPHETGNDRRLALKNRAHTLLAEFRAKRVRTHS